MQAAMEITARYCGKEMQDYGSCVASNPTSWQQQCHELKLKVARCTPSHPVIRKIRSDCAGEFTAFEQCLREHQAAVGSCAAHVTRFLSCVEAVDLASIGSSCGCGLHGRVIPVYKQGGKSLCQQPYHDWICSSCVAEAKQVWAWPVLGWETTWENQVAAGRGVGGPVDCDLPSGGINPNAPVQ